MPILTDEERLGTTLADKYELSRVLGSGGMGTVFAARHRWTGRRVAVKLLKPALATEPMVRERFLREARAGAALEHPNAVEVLDMGETEDGTVFLVLELLEGETLARLLATRGPLSVEETLTILLPVIDALGASHARGFLHRDVKPENIFLSPGPGDSTIPKLLDFGLAKALDAASSVQTATGHVLGTPYYMSPEQAAGLRELAPASDVWAVGVVLFECLSGELPFVGSSLTSVLLAIVSSSAPPLRSKASEVPPAIARVVDRALAADVEERIPTMDALGSALRQASGTELAGAARGSAAPRRDPARELPPTRAGRAVSGPPETARAELGHAPTLAASTPPAARPTRWGLVGLATLLGAAALGGGGWVIASALGTRGAAVEAPGPRTSPSAASGSAVPALAATPAIPAEGPTRPSAADGDPAPSGAVAPPPSAPTPPRAAPRPAAASTEASTTTARRVRLRTRWEEDPAAESEERREAAPTRAADAADRSGTEPSGVRPW